MNLRGQSNIKENGIINTVFNTSTIDDNAITKYNKDIEEATANGATMAEKQQIMKSAMEDTNKSTAQLIGTTNGAAVSTEALVAAQKQSTIASKAAALGLKSLSIAGNMVAGLLISFTVSKAVEGIYNLIHADEQAIEASNNAREAISKLKNEVQQNSEAAQEAGQRYAQLAQGVNQIDNTNMSLSTDEYEKFLDLSNQLAELFQLLSGDMTTREMPFLISGAV